MAITSGTITVSQSESDKMFVLEPGVAVNRLKPIELSAIKAPRWVWVYRSRQSAMDGDTSTVEVTKIVIASKTPETLDEKTRGRADVSMRKPDGTVAQTWAILSGMLSLEGAKPTFKTDVKTYSLRLAPACTIYEQIPASLSQIKVGDTVDLDMRYLRGRWGVTGINLRPNEDRQPGAPASQSR